jgi:DNA-directed RNA polymerase specialized sigma24 family protein
MARYCDGELGAFLRLYESTAPRILTYLATLTADATLARELLQETFLRLHENRARYVRGANPVPWISTLAHACFLQRQKTLRASGRADRSHASGTFTPPAVLHPRPGDSAFAPAEKIR